MTVIYVISLNYLRPLDEIDLLIPEHVEWLEKGYEDGIFLASGRKIPRTGGVILARSDNPESLQARLDLDPFQKAGLVATEIIPFEASMMSLSLPAI